MTSILKITHHRIHDVIQCVQFDFQNRRKMEKIKSRKKLCRILRIDMKIRPI